MTDSGKRATPRQARSEQTVQSILDAADTVFHEHGVGSATTTMIAKEAGLSVGALYRFFDDKTAIAVALADSFAELLADTVVAVEALIAEKGTEAIAESLAMVVDGIADLTKERPGYFEVMRHLRDHQLREIQIEMLARWFTMMSPRTVDLAARRRIALTVSEVTRALMERAPAKGKARQDHLDEIGKLLVPYLELHLS